MGKWSSSKCSAEEWVGLVGSRGGTMQPLVAFLFPMPSLKLWEAVTSCYSLS